MRRFIYILLAVALLAVVAVPVLGANAASRVQVVANVNSDESCQVSVTANLHIEQASGQLRFPVPVNATGIAVNGSTFRRRAPHLRHLWVMIKPRRGSGSAVTGSMMPPQPAARSPGFTSR